MRNRTSTAPWNLVLAAGEGRRMLPLTRALYGRDVPKQFASFDGGRTLLQRTIERIRPLAGPARTVVVVGEQHEGLARKQLRRYSDIEAVVQPRNLGTGPGLMLPLARILSRDPGAQVLVFPADHNIARPDRLVDACQRAISAAPTAECGVALVGVPAEKPATDLGWIVRGRTLGRSGARAVSQFCEKPDENTAMKLLASGSLCNTMILGGSAEALWRLVEHQLPRQAAILALLRVAGTEAPPAAVLRTLYGRLEPADFSRDVLERATGLGAVCMVDAGWSDWGTPERLFETVENRPRRRKSLERLRDLWVRADRSGRLSREDSSGNA